MADPAHDGIFKELLQWFPDQSQDYVERAAKAIGEREGAWRMYLLLALVDDRGTGTLSALVRSAREGYERAHPDMDEQGAWTEFDRLWASTTPEERWNLAHPMAYTVGVCDDCGGHTSGGLHRMPFKCGGCDSTNLKALHRA